jgi:hypothetical protein
MITNSQTKNVIKKWQINLIWKLKRIRSSNPLITSKIRKNALKYHHYPMKVWVIVSLAGNFATYTLVNYAQLVIISAIDSKSVLVASTLVDDHITPRDSAALATYHDTTWRGSLRRCSWTTYNQSKMGKLAMENLIWKALYSNRSKISQNITNELQTIQSKIDSWPSIVLNKVKLNLLVVNVLKASDKYSSKCDKLLLI